VAGHVLEQHFDEMLSWSIPKPCKEVSMKFQPILNRGLTQNLAKPKLCIVHRGRGWNTSYDAGKGIWEWRWPVVNVYHFRVLLFSRRI
jgi:hypothetical protein